MKIRSNSSKLYVELIDKVNPTKNRYRQRPIFDLIDFYHTKDQGFVYLTVVTIGDRNGSPILVYQIGGPTVVLEKVTDYLYRYPDPEDEVYIERTFEVEVLIDNTESRKKQTKVISDPSVYYLTSQIYPINLVEEAYTSSKGITGRILTTSDLGLFQSIFEESFTSISKINGIFKQSLFLYNYKNTDNNPFEPVYVNINKINGIMRQLLQTYVTQPEPVKTSVSRVTGILRQLLIQYNFYVPESLKTTINKIEATTGFVTPYHEIFINGNTIDYNPNDSDNGVTIIERSVGSTTAKSTNDQGIAYKSSNTSALDFENGLVDRLNSNTIWSKEGTGDLTSTNKLYSTNSFETKVSGDSLYTDSNILTGSGTPFTIEFNNLLKSQVIDNLPLFVKSSNSAGKGQGLYLSSNKTLEFYRHNAIGSDSGVDVYGSYKTNIAEINKITISYDSAAVRVFLNDKLDIVAGDTKGIVNTDLPYRFLANRIPSTGYSSQSLGILDNIVITNGLATKVRETDPNESFLIVDLAFDGENNSSKIVDNGTLGSNWVTNGSAKLSTTENFGSFSSLNVTNSTIGTDYIILNSNIDLKNTDFTISFEFLLNSFVNEYSSVIMASNLSNGESGCSIAVSSQATNRVIGMTFNSINFDSNNTLSGTTSIELNKKYKIDVVVENSILYLYINGKLDNLKSINTSIIDFTLGDGLVLGRGGTKSNSSPSINVWTSSMNGYIKNFKVYKGIAIKPTDNEYKIRLDFENNVLDTYKRSVWSNTGVTFNNVNSVKGYSAYFTGTGYDLISNNQFINLNNFSVKMDICFESSASFKVLLHVVNSLFLYYNTSSNQFMIETYNSGSYIGGWSSKVIKLEFLKYYNVRLVVKNSKAYIFVNNQIHDILTLTMPTTTGVTTTFRIGRPPSNTSYFFNGYIDNVEIIPNLLKYEGVWVQTVSAINGYGLQYNPNDTTQPTYTEMYNNTKGFGVLQFKTQASPNVSISLPNPVVINKSVLNKSFYITANNSWWSSTDINAQLELLDNNGQVVLALKWTKDGTYRHGMWYGPNLTNLTKADQKGSYPSTDGNMYFYKDRVVWSHNNTAENANLSFTYLVNLSNVTSLRVSGLSSLFDYPSGLCYFIMIENKENKVIELNRPTLHLPLETNNVNIGTAELTVNEVGSPSYQIFNGKKCIKFESGKYLNITSNPMFKFDYYTDFYIEMDFYYIPNGSSVVPLISSSSGQPFVDICIDASGFAYIYRETSPGGGITTFSATTACTPNAWNKIIFKRKFDTTSFVINNSESQTTKWFDIDLSLGSTFIGNTRSVYGIGYMSDLKIFLGSSEPSINYDNKVVLDLDFNPTRNSYLFKDNSGKSIINPINITERDYQDSQYCCSFNGTNQYLLLGKNDSFNFGIDDFIINIKFKFIEVAGSYFSTITRGLWNSSSPSAYFGVGQTTHPTAPNKFVLDISNTGIPGPMQMICPTPLVTGETYNITIVSNNKTVSIYINNVLAINKINSTNLNYNFNNLNNTVIGTGHGSTGFGENNGWFKGIIYSLKVLRNTSDLSVLNLPILNTPSSVYLPLKQNSTDIKTNTVWTNNSNRVVYENESAKFDGNTLTYLSTGVNSNFNYGTNDFTIGLDSYKTGTQSEARLISTLANNPGYYPRTEIKNSDAMGLTLVNYVSSPEVIYKTTKSGNLLNNWYNSRFSKINNTIFTYINDSLVDINSVPNGTQFNLNTENGTRIGGVGHTASQSYTYQGYIKNVYTNNSANISNVLPYLYLPYDTSLEDMGVNNVALASNNTSASVLTTVNDVKCTKITSGSTNPNIPNLYLGNIFTIKAKIYISTAASSGYNKPIFGTGWSSNISFLLSQFTEPWSGSANPELWLRTSGNNIRFAITNLMNTWIDVKITKTLTTLTLNVNGVDVGSIDSASWTESDFTSPRTFYIGDGGTDWKESSDFYIRDFKLYKGLANLPSTEIVSKRVFSLKSSKDDTKAYPFTDEARRHVVSATNMNKFNFVNIEGVDCIQFNGVNQYLELGQSKALNLTTEDFIITFKIYLIPFVHTGTSQWQVILANGSTNSSVGVSYVAYDQISKSLVLRATDNEVYRISNSLKEYAWNTVIITRQANRVSTTINNIVNEGVVSGTFNFNLNYNNNTYIGIDKWNTNNEYFKGYLADLQIVKGSSDISLVNVTTTETVTIINPPKSVYYPIKLNEVDSFHNSWYQTNTSNPVRLKEFNKGINTSMYFDGISSIYSTNTFNRIGLSKFTIECSIQIDNPVNVNYPMAIFSYGKDYNVVDWFTLEVTSTGVLRFCTSRSNSTYVSSPASTINYNTKYDIAVTRDTDYTLRIFVNGVVVASEIVTNCFDNYSQNSGPSYVNHSNYLFLGKRGEYWNSVDSSRGGFKGNIENFHYLVGTCKYTTNYSPVVDETLKLQTMSLLNVSDTTGTNPSTIVDTTNNITYTNTGCTVEAFANQLRPYSIRCQTTSNRLVSSVSESQFNLSNLNWTFDLVFRPMQTGAEAYILDTRANSTIFRGLVIRQPQTNPTTLMIEVGSTAATTVFESIYQSPSNTLVANTTYHLKLVRCREIIYVFLNGTLLTSINYGLKDIGYSNKIILFNNDLFTKGFNGYVTQFRFLKGISTDVFAFPQITQELK